MLLSCRMFYMSYLNNTQSALQVECCNLCNKCKSTSESWPPTIVLLMHCKCNVACIHWYYIELRFNQVEQRDTIPTTILNDAPTPCDREKMTTEERHITPQTLQETNAMTCNAMRILWYAWANLNWGTRTWVDMTANNAQDKLIPAGPQH